MRAATMCDDPATEGDDTDPAFDLDTADTPDPFALFDEWASPADTEAYAQL